MDRKKFLSLALAGIMTLSLAAPALAVPEGWTPADGARVAAEPWYAEAQAYVTEKGIMTGTDKGFEPEAVVTRGTVFQTLYNMEKPEFATLNLAFPDTQGAWYDAAANWAGTMELAQGDEKGLFNGDRAITRAELVVALHRYVDMKGVELPVVDEHAPDTVILENDFYVPQWAVEDFYWALQTGLIQGVSGEHSIEYYPNRTTTRAELATVLMRLDQATPAKPAYIEEAVSYESDGRTVPAIVTLPAGEGPFPAVVINHGHGGSKDENTGFPGVARALAEAGIASIRMDFPGCGESEASFQDNTMTNMIADSNAGLAYLTENYPIDAQQVGILGYSMGGRIASQVVGAEDAPYKAVVLLSAANVSIEEMAANLFGSLEAYNELKATAEKDGFAVFTTVYGQVQELSKAWFEDMESGKPMEDLAKFDGPVLVLHGDKDEMITDEMNKAIVAAYPEAVEVVVPEADHGYGFYSDQPDVTAAVEGSITGFFTQNLMGKLGPCSAAAISKYGNVGTDLSGYALTAAGYEVGDILTVEITGQEPITLPLGTGYSNVDQGSPLALMDTSNNTLALAINRGDFATTYGLGVKGEDGVYAITEGVTITLSMAEKGGYLDEMEIRELDSKRTNDREDYSSDEVFANFRAITMGDIADGMLYRTSSPVNPELGRNTYADGFLKEAGVKTVVNLADSQEEMEAYDGYAGTYYATLNVIGLNMGVDMYSDDAKASLKAGLEFMIANEGPYAFHCTEGKDRAGYFAMLLEALMGAKPQEIITDYMLSFENYYHVANRTEQWMKIAESNIEKDLIKLAGVEDSFGLDGVDLSAAAEKYMVEELGLTVEQVTSLKTILSGK